MKTAGAQTIGGAKTFSDEVTVNANIATTGTVDGVDVGDLDAAAGTVEVKAVGASGVKKTSSKCCN